MRPGYDSNFSWANLNPLIPKIWLLVNSPLSLLYISLYISLESLVWDQDNNFYLISLSVLITFLLDNVWIL